MDFKNVDEYIAYQHEKVRPNLELIRKTIKKAAPQAEEMISYQMPAYKFHGVLIWFAVAKNHYGIYIRPLIMQAFLDELKDFELSKSAIRIPFDKPIPKKLITDIVRYAVAKNMIDKQLKDEAKKKRKIK